eukprot:403376918
MDQRAPVKTFSQEVQSQMKYISDVKDVKLDKSMGCVIGAFIGDAAGGVLEFMKDITQEQVDNAMLMPGGGAMRLGNGQITDDSEMAMCIFQGLLEGRRNEPQSGQLVLDLDNITKYFGLWRDAAFDIGNTTFKALVVINAKKPSPFNVYGNVMKVNVSSQTNGCLMRITPLAVWCQNLSDEELFEAVKLQTQLTHCHPNAVRACQLYCLAIKHLINNPGDAAGAYLVAKSMAGDIASWFEAIETGQLPPATKNIGHSKIAFTYSFHYLLQVANDPTLTYEKCIKQMLLAGGDTDTNAAIVGGLLGAYFGVGALPQNMIEAMLSFKTESDELKKQYGGQIRPRYLIPHYTLLNDITLITQNAPNMLVVQYMGELYDEQEKIKQIITDAKNAQITQP